MKKMLLFSIIILIFLTLSAVQAEDSLAAGADEKTFDAIQHTIDDSSEFSTIALDGSYSGDSAAVNVNKSVTIKGSSNGASLNAADKSQILVISADNVVVENLKFLRGNSKYASTKDYGGAIYATGNNLKIVNCTFASNSAYYGAGISARGDNVSIINCQFTTNTAQYSGGAIELDGNDCYVADCIFKNNIAGHVGGAVAWVGANGMLSNSTFDNYKIDLSKSSQFGGAVVWMGANGTLQQSTFANFLSKKSGAAVYWRGENGTLNYCIFEDNNSTVDLAYWGNPEYAGFNYWGKNFNSTEQFAENNMIYYNGSSQFPANWVVIKNDADSISFVLNNGSALEKYLPDYNYNNIVISKNIYIVKKSTKISASNIKTYCLYNKKSLKITLKSGNNPLSNKKVQIKLNGVTYNKITNKNGIVNFKVKLKKSKVYKASVSFNGDAWYNSSSKTVKITVKKQKPKLTVKTKVLKLNSKRKIVKVVFKSQFKKAISKKTLKLTINKKTYKARTNSKGVCKFKITLKTKKTYKFKVKFSGNKYYTGLTKSGKIKVK